MPGPPDPASASVSVLTPSPRAAHVSGLCQSIRRPGGDRIATERPHPLQHLLSSGHWRLRESAAGVSSLTPFPFLIGKPRPPRAESRIRGGPAPGRGHQRAGRQGAQIEAAIEAIGDRAEVAGGILARIDAVMRTLKPVLRWPRTVLPQRNIGKSPRLHVPKTVGRLVDAAAVGDTGEAGQAIGDDDAGGGEVRTDPVGDRGAGEAGDKGWSWRAADALRL
jgi:hypothetical protein